MKKVDEQIIVDALRRAKELAHPDHPGLSEQDRKEIKAYHAGLSNLEEILKGKGLFKSISIIPSPRIDYCSQCGKEHGFDCPLDRIEPDTNDPSQFPAEGSDMLR